MAAEKPAQWAPLEFHSHAARWRSDRKGQSNARSGDSLSFDLAQGRQAKDQPIYTYERAKSVWVRQPAPAKLLQLGMNQNIAAQSNNSVNPRCEVCPLSRVKAGVSVRIKQLCASPEHQDRLRELGVFEDQVIRLLNSQTSFICQVCNARLAISDKLAQMIMVEPLTS